MIYVLLLVLVFFLAVSDSADMQSTTLAIEKPVIQEAAKTMSFLPRCCDMTETRRSPLQSHVICTWILEPSKIGFYGTKVVQIPMRVCT